MWNYQANTYGDRMAPVYDAYHADLDSTAAVERLTELAGAGRVLELGVGTGRIAIPLAERGIEVHGIDVSDAMLAQLPEPVAGWRDGDGQCPRPADGRAVATIGERYLRPR